MNHAYTGSPEATHRTEVKNLTGKGNNVLMSHVTISILLVVVEAKLESFK